MYYEYNNVLFNLNRVIKITRHYHVGTYYISFYFSDKDRLQIEFLTLEESDKVYDDIKQILFKG